MQLDGNLEKLKQSAEIQVCVRGYRRGRGETGTFPTLYDTAIVGAYVTTCRMYILPRGISNVNYGLQMVRSKVGFLTVINIIVERVLK